MQRTGANKQLAASVLLAMLLSSHVAAMRMNVQYAKRAVQMKKLENSLNPADIEKMVQEGKQIAANLQCEQLPARMADVVKNATSYMLKICPADKPCTLRTASGADVQDLSLGAMTIATYADVADKKGCLGETMQHPSVVEVAAALKDTWHAILEGVGTSVVQNRMQQASEALTGWQADLADLKDSVLDRKLFFPNRIEDPEHCPAPCAKCTQAHNSWFKGNERFSFKCLIDKAASVLEPPSDPELRCSPVQARNWHTGYKTWCEVPDWKTSAYQKAKLVAKVACGAEEILSPLHSGKGMPKPILSTCLKIQEGKVITDKAMEEYKRFSTHSDYVVSKGAKAVFSIFLSLGQAEAIGELRRGTHGNIKPKTNASSSIDQEVAPIAEAPTLCEPHDTMSIFEVSARVLLTFVGGLLISPFIAITAAAASGLFWITLAILAGKMSFANGGAIVMAESLTMGILFSNVFVGISAGLYGFVLAHQFFNPPNRCFLQGVEGGKCIEGLAYGESMNMQCDSGENIAVTCHEEHGGVMTSSSSCY